MNKQKTTKKNFIDEYGSTRLSNQEVINDFGSVDTMFYPAPTIEPIFDSPAYFNPTEVIYNPKDQIGYGDPIYTPIVDDVIFTPFVPQFPDPTQLDCSQLQMQIESLNQTLMTSRMDADLRAAYERALSDAQDQYILKCQKKDINPIGDECPDPVLARPPHCMTYEKYYAPNAKCPSYVLVQDKSDPMCIGDFIDDEPICPDVEPPVLGECEKLEMAMVNGCKQYKVVKDPACGGTGGTGSGGGTTGSGSGGTSTGGGTTGSGSGGTSTGTGGGTTGGGTNGTGSGGGFVDDKDKTQLPSNPVSKNLTPYIYAGIGIVVILIVSRMLTKKD